MFFRSIDTTTNATETNDSSCDEKNEFDHSSHDLTHEENEVNNIEQSITIPVENNIQQSIDISDSNDTNIQEMTTTPINDISENEQLTTDHVE